MAPDARSVTQLRAELHAARERARETSATVKTPGPLRLRSDARTATTPMRRARVEEPEEATRQAASARALAHKAARYDKLAHGYGLYEEGLVDWDAKDVESLPSTPSPPPTEMSDLVEYTDEFGRTRMVHASDVPRENDEQYASEDDHAIYGPATT
ncbi:hypothetical protein MEQU1_003438 [Malassezia equina]|uniref:CCDC174 alpha/beta GRSR domain-containing protein n=1 Tax=Malassezia equina TaxID=1381935 RepID=A0AAF0EHE2_9BASI|nr:hypothetical protein MEQU1_003438 [Malassezia equina]